MHASKALFERLRRPERERSEAVWASANKIAEKDQSRRAVACERLECIKQHRKLAVAAVHVADSEDGLIDAQGRFTPVRLIEKDIRRRCGSHEYKLASAISPA